MRKATAIAFSLLPALHSVLSAAQFAPGTEFDNQPALTTINISPAYSAGLSGAGVRLGLVDSGINPNHSEFPGAIVAGYDAITGLSGTSDFANILIDHVNHGTFIASVAAGRLDGNPRPNNMQGVAFNSSLVIGAMNFFDDAATTDSHIASALNFVSNQSTSVINNSWAWGEGLLDPLAEYQDFLENLPLTNTAIKSALERGSVLVFTTGNYGGANPLATGMLPSHDPEIAARGAFIVVTAASIDGTTLPDYANRCGLSKEYCIAAPGGDGDEGQPAATQFVLGADAESSLGNDRYFYQSATSVAAPLVSGAVALVAEQFPWMSNSNLATTILTTASRASAPDSEWGRGLLDVGRAIQGPALFETDFEADVAREYNSVFSNDIGHRAGLKGGLTKLGAGTLTLTGSNSYTGTTRVDAGTLVINGSLTSPLTVASGGILRGVGSLSGALAIDGMLAPGDSLGTLNVSGTVTMNPGSWYQIGIDGTTSGNGPGNYSRLLVTGIGNQFVAAGTIQAVLSDIPAVGSPGFTPMLGDNFRVVSAEGGIVGRFSTLTQPDDLGSGTRLAAFYDVFYSRSIDLKVVPMSYAAYLSESSSNSRSSAAALDQILDRDQVGAASTEQTQLLYVTASKTAPELPRFAQSLSGEVHGALAATTPQASQWLEGAVQRRSGVLQPTVQTIAKSANEAAAANPLWLDVGWNHVRRKTDGNASGFDSNRTQLVLGADLVADETTHLGIGLSHADTDVSAAIGSGTLTETIGFVYARQQLSDFLLQGMASYGSGNADSTRPDPTAMTENFGSELTTSNTLLNLRLHRPVTMAGQRVEPFASVTWQKTRRGAFDEGNAVAALASPGDSATGVRTVVGLAGSSLQQDPLSTARSYRFSLGLGHDAGELTRPQVSATLAGIRSTIAPPAVGRSFVQSNAFGSVRIHPRAYGYLGLNSELRQGLSDVGITIGAVLVL